MKATWCQFCAAFIESLDNFCPKCGGRPGAKEVSRSVWVTGGGVATVWYADSANADWADLVARVLNGGVKVAGFNPLRIRTEGA